MRVVDATHAEDRRGDGAAGVPALESRRPMASPGRVPSD